MYVLIFSNRSVRQSSVNRQGTCGYGRGLRSVSATMHKYFEYAKQDWLLTHSNLFHQKGNGQRDMFVFSAVFESLDLEKALIVRRFRSIYRMR